ncbi:MAG: hypothetical protein ACXAD7_25410, partial [Candidatus Kariarchaeaceae archaeon]
MRLRSTFMLLSSYILILAVTPIVYLLAFGSSSIKIDWVVVYNCLLVLSLTLLLLVFFQENPINRKLRSQRILVAIILLEIFGLLCESIAVHGLSNGNTEDFRIVFALVQITDAFQGVLFLYHISLFKQSHLQMITTLIGSFILASPLALIAVNDLSEILEFQSFVIFVTKYPSFMNSAIMLVSYMVAGFYILYSILRSSNFRLLRFEPTLERQYVLILAGYVLFFCISPLLLFVQQFVDNFELLIVVVLVKSISIIGLMLIVLPCFYSFDLSVNLIPQSIEKLMVMNSVGLPLLSYDFEYVERVLYSDLLVTSSLTAIVGYLTHSSVLSRRITSISFEDRILFFRSKNDFTFLSIVNRKTKILESAMNLFVDEFLKVVDPKASRSGFLKGDYQKNIQVQHMIEQCLGTNFIASPSIVSTSITTPDGGFPLGRLIVALVMVLSAQRMIIFQSTSILLPDDTLIAPIVIIIIYTTSTYLSGTLVNVKQISTDIRLLYFLISLFTILMFTSSGLIQLILSWGFAFLSWWYLVATWLTEFQRLDPKRRYQVVLFSFILDFAIRSVSFGTDLLIYRAQWVVVFKFLVIVFLVILVNNFRIDDELKSVDPNFNAFHPIYLSIVVLYAVRFYLNIGHLTHLISGVSVISFLLLTLFVISYLFIFCSKYVVNPLFSANRLTWFILGVIPIMHILSLDMGYDINLPFVLLSPISMSFLTAFIDNETLRQRGRIPHRLVSFLHYIVPGSVFIIAAISYYGGSKLLLLLPLTFFTIFKVPKIRVSKLKISGREPLSFGLFILILLSFSIPPLMSEIE